MLDDGRFEAGERSAVAPSPLRLALSISLVLHGAVLYWLALRDAPEAELPETRSFEVTLTRPTAAERAPAEPVPAAERREDADPSTSDPVQPDDAPEPPGAVQPDVPLVRAPAPEVPAVENKVRRPLDLSLPAGVIGPTQTPAPAAGVFDPMLRERIRTARSARSAPPVADVQTWSVGAGDRTRVETEDGCFERVDDPFADQPGEQWWLVACSPGDRIDWGARFRARP